MTDQAHLDAANKLLDSLQEINSLLREFGKTGSLDDVDWAQWQIKRLRGTRWGLYDRMPLVMESYHE